VELLVQVVASDRFETNLTTKQAFHYDVYIMFPCTSIVVYLMQREDAKHTYQGISSYESHSRFYSLAFQFFYIIR
jgi:hypothetical protein